MQRYLTPASLLLALLAGQLAAQELVYDFNPATEQVGLSAGALQSCGDRVIFLGSTPGTGFEPWITDGTPGGTRQLVNLDPDPYASYNYLNAGALQGDYFFMLGSVWWTIAGNPQPILPGGESRLFAGLYRTDGTPGGTTQLAHYWPSFVEGGHAIAGQRLFFSGISPSDSSLWVSDGTASGTQPIANFSLAGWPGELKPWGSSVLFFAGDAVTGREFWISDGTPSGTVLIRDIAPGSASGCEQSTLHLMGGAGWFTADDGAGIALWTTDGTTPGTFPVSLPITGDFRIVAAAPGHLFLDSDDGLWVCDGTAAGTTLVSTVKPIGFPVVHNSELIFSVNPSFSTFELWKSNGTAAGTQVISAQGPFDSSTPSLVVAGNDVYFVPGLTNQLYRVVFGTTGATGVQPVNPDLAIYFDIRPAMAPAGNRLIVAASANGGPQSLWITDGTPGGTTAVVPPEEFGADIGQKTSYALAPATVQIASMGTKLLLITPNGSDAEFWHTDGTADGTHLRYVGLDGGRPASRIFRVEDSHLFVLEYANQVQEVWISRRGRLPVPFSELSGHVVGIAERIVGSSGSFALVEVYASTFGSQLWRTDGTSSGTNLLMTMPYPPGNRLLSAFAGGGLVYFSVGGFRLWRSDGTSAGTYEIASGVSVGSGEIHGSPTPHVQYGNEEFFFVDGGSNTGLWATDGTPGGTRPIHGIPSMWSVEGFGVAVVAGKVVFTGHSAAEGVELWISDGTPGGTQLLADLAPGATSSDPSDFVNYEGRLYFFARTPANGRELWVSDGTSAGTHIVRDIMPGEFSSMPEDLIAAGGALYFKAWTREHGAELWRSDGTEAGTRMLADIAPGIGDSSPTRFTRAGNRLYFLARTDKHGVELYSVRVAQDESDDDSGCAAGGNPSGNAMLVLLLAALLAAAGFRGRLVVES